MCVWVGVYTPPPPPLPSSGPAPGISFSKIPAENPAKTEEECVYAYIQTNLLTYKTGAVGTAFGTGSVLLTIELRLIILFVTR